MCGIRTNKDKVAPARTKRTRSGCNPIKRQLERIKAMKYKVQITRKETYTASVEVEADNPDEAKAIAEARELENEYVDLFDLPDEVEKDFTVLDGNGGTPAEDEPTRYPSFKKLKVDCDVQWDYDEGDTPPDPHFEVSFSPEELENAGILDRSNIEETAWELYEGRLEEFMSEYLTNFTDFCHKGFTMKVKPIS